MTPGFYPRGNVSLLEGRTRQQDCGEQEIMEGLIVRFFSEEGTTSIEYALMASFLFLAIIIAVCDLGNGLINLFRTVAAKYPQ